MSARARASPAARRSENSASCWTGVTTELLKRQARNPPSASDSKTARMTPPLEPLGRDVKSSREFPFDSRPAWNARPMTTKSASPLTKTSAQMVELNRDFITSSKLFPAERLVQPASHRKSQIDGPGNTSSNL